MKKLFTSLTLSTFLSLTFTLTAQTQENNKIPLNFDNLEPVQGIDPEFVQDNMYVFIKSSEDDTPDKAIVKTIVFSNTNHADSTMQDISTRTYFFTENNLNVWKSFSSAAIKIDADGNRDTQIGEEVTSQGYPKRLKIDPRDKQNQETVLITGLYEEIFGKSAPFVAPAPFTLPGQ